MIQDALASRSEPQRRVIVAMVAMAAATGSAALAGIAPTAVILVCAGVGGLVVLLAMPVSAVAATAVAATAVAPTLSIAYFNYSPLLGQGRIVTLMAALAITRYALAPSGLRIPREALVVIGAFGLTLFISTQSAFLNGTARVDILAELQRDVAYVICGFIIGLVAAQAALHRGKELSLFRALAGVHLVASSLAIINWQWSVGNLPLGGTLEAVLQSVLNFARDQEWGDARASFPFSDQHPNLASAIFVLLAAFIVPPLLSSKERRDRVLATLAIVGAALAAFTTESRTGLLVLPVAPAIYVALSPSVPRRGRIIALSVAVAAAFGALVFANTLLPEERRFSNLDTIDSRYSIWGEALHDVADHPIIGLGYAVSRSARWGESIHNELLGRLVDGGVLHAAAFVAVLLVMTRMGLQLWRAEDQRYSAVGVGMLAALAVLVMYMQVSATWVSSSVSAILSWMFFGIATAFVEGLRADQRARVALERPALGTRRDAPRFRPTARRSPR